MLSIYDLMFHVVLPHTRRTGWSREQTGNMVRLRGGNARPTWSKGFGCAKAKRFKTTGSLAGERSFIPFQ